MSGKKAGLVIGGLVFAVAIILLLLRGVAVRRKTAKLQEQQQQAYEEYLQQEQQAQQDQQTQQINSDGMVSWGETGTATGQPAENTGVDATVLNDVNSRQNSVSDLGGDTTGSSEGQNTQSQQGSDENQPQQVNNDELPVADTLNNSLTLNLMDKVEIVNTYEANVLVSAKSIYKVNNSCYAYAISMIIPIEGKGYQLIDYLCSVATWNSVNNGDSIVVTYGLDENGLVVIKGLSK